MIYMAAMKRIVFRCYARDLQFVLPFLKNIEAAYTRFPYILYAFEILGILPLLFPRTLRPRPLLLEPEPQPLAAHQAVLSQPVSSFPDGSG